MSKDDDSMRKAFNDAMNAKPDPDAEAFENSVRVAPHELRAEMLRVNALEGNIARLKVLLSYGTKVNERAVFAAVEAGQDQAVALLLSKDSTVESAVRDRALVAAIRKEKVSVCRLLLARGARADYNNNEPIYYATLYGNADIIDMLARAGADVMARGGSLLCMALAHKHEKAAKALISHGVDPFTLYENKNAKAWANNMELEKIAKLIDDITAVPQTVDKNFFTGMTLEDMQRPRTEWQGFNAMQIAAHNGHIDVIFDKLTVGGRKMTARDLIVASGEKPQTVLHIMGRKKELGRVFNPVFFAQTPEEIDRAWHYVPAAFRAQVDVGALKEEISRLGFMLRLHAKKRPGLQIGKKDPK